MGDPTKKIVKQMKISHFNNEETISARRNMFLMAFKKLLFRCYKTFAQQRYIFVLTRT